MFDAKALDVTVWRDGMEYKQTYSRGKPVTTLLRNELPAELSARRGTCIRFWPDKEGLLSCFILMLCFLS